MKETAHVAKKTNTSRVSSPGASVPLLVANGGEQAAWRFLELFAVSIRNKNTPPAYGQVERDEMSFSEIERVGI
jgi:hypothetical protein